MREVKRYKFDRKNTPIFDYYRNTRIVAVYYNKKNRPEFVVYEYGDEKYPIDINETIFLS